MKTLRLLPILLAALLATRAGAAKYALCVGINQYSLSGCSTLRGCVNDATYFRNNLINRGGWTSGNATLLTNSSATKSAIRNAIANAASRAVSGDTFVFQHSSHGGRHGTTRSTYLCAYNACYEDTELAADLSAFRSGVKVVVIVDACHSGGLFKGAGDSDAAPFDLAERVSEIMDREREAKRRSGARDVDARLASSEIGWVTAADYDEYSWDGGYYDVSSWMTSASGGSTPGGVFLAAFTWGWWNGSADTGAVGDRDGQFDAYEGWRYAYDVCVRKHDDFTPQYLNTSVLRSVELGTSGSGGSTVGTPGNDNFSNAWTVSVATGSASGTTVNATRESGEPAHNGRTTGSIWWKWTAGASGTAAFDTNGSGFDTVMAVYTGSSVSALSAVCSDDDGGDGTCSRCSFSATSGRTYYIAVAGYSSTGSVALNWSLPTGSTGNGTLGQAVDNGNLTFTTGGDASWFVTTGDSVEGGSSARSGRIGASSSTWMQATGATGAGVVTFRWKVSSENRYDWVEFYIDGEFKFGRSGAGAWREEAFAVGAGSHTFKWVYSKDGSLSSGSDCAWVDKVTWTANCPLVPVFRFYSSAYRGHFFTTNESERNDLIRNNPKWNYEGVAWYAYPTQASGTTPLYRFYSRNYHAHFFTRSEQEASTLRWTNPNWNYEGISSYVRSSSGCGSTPVYRFWSSRYKHHFYTANYSECQSVISGNRNWSYEGVAYYAWASPEDWAQANREAAAAAKAATTAPTTKVAPPAAMKKAAAPAAWTLVAADGTVVPAEGEAEVGERLVETWADAPDADDVAAGAYADASDAEAVALRLSLPEGVHAATLWSAAVGPLADEDAEGAFEFELPADGAWHWLRVEDADGEEAFSLWLRAE